MNDPVRASSLFGGAHSPTAGPSGMPGTVPNPPPEVVRLSVGTPLHGVVEGNDGEGRLLVRTELGTLSVATKAQLPADSAVTLQIRSSGAQLHVLLMHSETPPGGARGTPAPNPQQSSAPHGGTAGPQAQPGGAPVTGQAASAGQLVGQGAIPDELTLGQTVRAVVQAPTAAPNRTPGPVPDPAPVASSGTSAGAGANLAPSRSSLSALAAQLIPGSELQFRIVTVQAPAQAPSAQATAPNTAATSTGAQAADTAPRTLPPGSSSPLMGPPAGAPGTLATPAGPATQTVGQPALPSTQAPATPVPATGVLVAVAGQSVATAPTAVVAPAAPGGNAPAGPAIQASVPTTGAPTQSSTALSGATAGVPAGVPAGATAGATAGAPVGTAPVSPAPATTTPAPTLLTSYAAPGTDHPAAPGAAPAARGAVQPAAPPGTGVPAEGTAAPGALRFTGTVTAITHAGQPVLQTPLGTLTLEIQAPLPIGSRLTLELPAQALPRPAPAGVFQAPESLGTLAHAWPALEEALQALPEIAAPGIARAALDMVPQPGPKLASGLLFFLAALSAGEVGRWLGNPATQALKNAGRETLLSRLGQDFGQLSRLAETPGSDWRLFFIPLLDGEQLQQFRLFLRHGEHGHDGNGGGEDDEPTRFVVEVELSRLGDLQLDGLVRHKRLDLILRTRAPLPEFMRHDIARIFHDANDAMGFGGSIGFQSSAEWQFMPIEAPATTSPGVIV